MLSEEVRGWMIDEDVYDDEGDPDGVEDLVDLGAAPDSAFVDFYAHCGEASIMGEGPMELDGLVWMIRNAGWLETRMHALDALELPETMIQLSPLEGGAFFYDALTGAVWDVEYGDKLTAARERTHAPDWPDFESFLVWFFAID